MSDSEIIPLSHDVPDPAAAPPTASVPIDVVTFLEPPVSAIAGETQDVLAQPVSRPSATPGPGLPESIGWTALVLSSQIAATVVIMVCVMIYLLAVNGGRMPKNALNLEEMSPNGFAVVSGLPGFLGYLVLIPLACWRISPTPLRKLNFAPPSLTQALIVCCCVIPLGFVSDALYSFVLPLWESFLDQFPALSPLRDMGLAESMRQLNGASLPLLLFFLSVVPAVGEEWILRGLIGRGLVARWGLAPGIFLTSVLFAVMHLDPPHVAAVFPIGIMMHIVYLTTRSFWMPILYHFLNNATVSVFTSLAVAEPGETEAGVSWLVYVAPPFLALAVGLLWKLRTRYVAADGVEAGRGYFSFEHYPEAEARRVAPNHVLVGAAFAVLLAVQIGGIAWDVWAIRQEQSAPETELELHPAVAAISLSQGN